MPPGDKMVAWTEEAEPGPAVTVIGAAAGRCALLTCRVTSYLDDRRSGEVQMQSLTPDGDLVVDNVAELVVCLLFDAERTGNGSLQSDTLRPVVRAMEALRADGRDGQNCVVIADGVARERREETYRAVTGTSERPLQSAVVVSLRAPGFERIKQTALTNCKQLDV